MAYIPFLNNAYFSAKVGIGTDSPGEALEVAGKIISDTHFMSSDTNVTLSAQSGGNVYLRPNGNSSTIGQVIVNSSGNVGIGTTSPAGKLHVSDTATLTAVYQKFTNGTTGHTSNDGTTLGIDSDGDFLINNNEAKEIKLYTSDIQRLTISSAGAVKFNSYNSTNKTGTPTYLLGTDASGNIVKTNTVPGSAAGPYLPLTGGTMTGVTQFNDHTQHGDQVSAKFGAGNDLQIYHDGSNSFIQDTGTGDLYVDAAANFFVRNQANGEVWIKGTDSGVSLRYQDSQKLITTSAGISVTGLMQASTVGVTNIVTNKVVKFNGSILDDSNITDTGSLITLGSAVTATGTVTAPTFLGDLGATSTINTGVTAVTKANATNDTTVATTAFVQNLIGTIPAGLVFQGTWNAATNTPTLTSGSGTTGHFYIVSTSGSTNLDGVTDWVTGDWAVFIEQGGTDAWEKIDNSSVLDGAGTGQTLPLWSGSGTSNTLTNSKLVQNTAGTLITAFTNSTGNTGNFITNSEGGGEVGLTVQSRTNRAKLRVADNDSNAYVVAEAGKAFFGTSANGDATNITVLTSGNVGIGTTSPSGLLHVHQTGSGTSNSIITEDDARKIFIGRDSIKATDLSNNAAMLYLQQNGGNATLGGEVHIPSYIYHIGDTNTLFGFGGQDLFLINTGGGRRLTVTNTEATFENNLIVDGKVGIGTTSPGYKLTVAGDAGFSDWIYASKFYPTSSTTDILMQTGAGRTITLDPTSTGKVLIPNGNVGIGTTSPTQAKLVVSGNVAFNQGDETMGQINPEFERLDFKVSDGVVDATPVAMTLREYAGGARLGIGTTSPGYKLSVSGNIGLTDGVSTGLLALVGGNYYIQNTGAYSTVFQTNGAERMRITSTGNVGIGTTSPDSFNSEARNLVVNGSGDVGISIATTTTTGNSSVVFADGTGGTAGYRGRLKYGHTDT